MQLSAARHSVKHSLCEWAFRNVKRDFCCLNFKNDVYIYLGKWKNLLLNTRVGHLIVTLAAEKNPVELTKKFWTQSDLKALEEDEAEGLMVRLIMTKRSKSCFEFIVLFLIDLNERKSVVQNCCGFFIEVRSNYTPTPPATTSDDSVASR